MTHKVALHTGVYGGENIVEEDSVGACVQRAGQRDARFLAAGYGMRTDLCKIAVVHGVKIILERTGVDASLVPGSIGWRAEEDVVPDRLAILEPG